MFGFDKNNDDGKSDAVSSTTDVNLLQHNSSNPIARRYEKMLEELESEVRGHIRF